MIALAAKRLNRPVKLVATRAQGFTDRDLSCRDSPSHPARRPARRQARRLSAMKAWEISSRPDPYVVAGVDDHRALYAFGAIATKVNVVHADRSTPGFMRSPPVVPYIFALESAMDELAIKLDMDPVEFRRINDTMKSPVDRQTLLKPLADAVLRPSGQGLWLEAARRTKKRHARRRLACWLRLRDRALSDPYRSGRRARAAYGRTATCACRPRRTKSATAFIPCSARWRLTGLVSNSRR